MSRNLRTVLIFGSFISLIGAAFYPIYFRPLMRLEEYRLKVWSDPFGRK
uniref:Small integral membrane protein 20 n=1 Tax=Ailuropoda melanoleuca TaxID=9646 RepID=G1MIC9_AILME